MINSNPSTKSTPSPLALYQLPLCTIQHSLQEWNRMGSHNSQTHDGTLPREVYARKHLPSPKYKTMTFEPTEKMKAQLVHAHRRDLRDGTITETEQVWSGFLLREKKRKTSKTGKKYFGTSFNMVD